MEDEVGEAKGDDLQGIEGRAEDVEYKVGAFPGTMERSDYSSEEDSIQVIASGATIDQQRPCQRILLLVAHAPTDRSNHTPPTSQNNHG